MLLETWRYDNTDLESVTLSEVMSGYRDCPIISGVRRYPLISDALYNYTHSQTLNNSLQDPSVPVSSENFFECIENVVDNQRILEDNLKQLPSLAKANDRKQFASAVDEISDALSALQGSAAQTAYLIGEMRR